MKIYTKKGDDGSTGLFYGGRVDKDDTGPAAYGTVDEAVSALGMTRAIALTSDPELSIAVLGIQRELFVVGAELAANPEARAKLDDGVSRVTTSMVERLETAIDDVVDDRGMPTDFVVPGENPLAASLDVARSIVRRAERRAVSHVRVHELDESLVVPYLNRLADLLFMLARAAEDSWTPTKGERG